MGVCKNTIPGLERQIEPEIWTEGETGGAAESGVSCSSWDSAWSPLLTSDEPVAGTASAAGSRASAHVGAARQGNKATVLSKNE
ncbi:MAG: hypothetical protein AMXMBFR67_13910 [Nitrospira sp.]